MGKAIRGKVVVALSGGVDSAVVAWLLKDAGYEVIGISLRLAPDGPGEHVERTGRCCSIDDLSDARRVCEKIGIPFYAIDSRQRFYETVFQPFVKSYQQGITPIPCVACNHEVKFGDLYQTAKNLNAQLATGHYAKAVSHKGQNTLARPLDTLKDQTYYLYGTPKETVDNLILPLGELRKPEVRSIAKEIGLLVHDKKDSQEICFVPDGDHAKVVERTLGHLPEGNFVDVSQRVLGKHQGIHHFTIGQRRGLGVSARDRLYVADINPARQEVVLGDKESLMCSTIEIREFHSLVPLSLWPETVMVQIRARNAPSEARLERYDSDQKRVIFRFLEPVQSVALGQAGCVYEDEVLLGGGLISGRLDGLFPRSLS